MIFVYAQQKLLIITFIKMSMFFSQKLVASLKMKCFNLLIICLHFSPPLSCTLFYHKYKLLYTLHSEINHNVASINYK
jgi:hypothetical protein